MANQEHLDRLRAGVEAWNKWREENIGITPDLQEAHLERANLERANLQDAHLEGAMLEDAHLERANLQDAHLEGANFIRAHLEGANLQYAHLERANLTVAHLERANLTVAHLEGAMLAVANLKNADLRWACLEKTAVEQVQYNRWTHYKGARVDSCYGNARFKRFALDQQFIEEFRESKLRWPFYIIWLVFADCGRSLLLWSAWSVAIATSFGIKYYSMGLQNFQVNLLPWGLKSMMYYSVVTFTTLGYGDIYPKTIEAAQWVIAEVVVGYIMLGGMISIFATKLARRS